MRARDATVSLRSLFRRNALARRACRVSSDKLIGDVVEVIADNLRLRTDSQHIVADTLDERGLPARRYGAESVPCVQAIRQSWDGLTPRLFFGVGVSLARWLVMLHAVGAETPFKQIDNAAMGELARLHFKQIVREAKEPETGTAKLAQCSWNLGVGRICPSAPSYRCR